MEVLNFFKKKMNDRKLSALNAKKFGIWKPKVTDFDILKDIYNSKKEDLWDNLSRNIRMHIEDYSIIEFRIFTIFIIDTSYISLKVMKDEKIEGKLLRDYKSNFGKRRKKRYEEYWKIIRENDYSVPSVIKKYEKKDKLSEKEKKDYDNLSELAVLFMKIWFEDSNFDLLYDVSNGNIDCKELFLHSIIMSFIDECFEEVHNRFN